MEQNLTTEINEAFDDFITTFSSIKEDQIDVIPFKDSWTAGQTGEHIVKSVSGLKSLFNGKTSVTTRQYDEHCAMLRNIFLDFTIKMASPDFVTPVETHHDKNAMLHTLTNLKKDALDAARNMDLTPTCNDAEMPGMGLITRMEWLTFFIVHVKRHAHQLKNIKAALNTQYSNTTA